MKNCICGSDLRFEDCCKSFSDIFKHKDINSENLLLVDWLKKSSIAHQESYHNLTHKYFYRISLYFENILLLFNEVSLKSAVPELDETIINIRLNIIHSLLSSTTLMAQGLFLQSGVLHRTAFEDLFVILDFVENPIQFEKFKEGKYSTNKVLNRIKDNIPEPMARWYGYFTANFTHFCEIHTIPFLPRKCHPDNYIIILGFQNLIRLMVSYHIVLERIYFPFIDNKYFWEINRNNKLDMDLDSSPISDWVESIGKEIKIDFPINDKRGNLNYSEKTYKFK